MPELLLILSLWHAPAPIFPVHAYDAEGNMKYYEDGRPMYDAGNGETDGTSKTPYCN